MKDIRSVAGMSHTRLIVILTLLLLVGGMSTDIYIPSLPEITKNFNTTPEISSFTVSLFLMATAVSGLFASIIGDRFGRKKAISYSSIFYIVSSVLISISPFMSLIIFFRAIQGASVGIIFIVTRQVIKDLYTEKEQVNINSILYTAFVVSPALAPVLGSIIAEYLSWRACFIFTSLIQLFLYFNIKNIFKETIPKTKPLPHPITFIGSFPAFFMTKDFNACVLISGLSYAAYFAFITISSFIFISDYGFSTIGYSSIFIFLAIMYLVGNYLMRIFNNRNMPKPQIIFYGCFLNVVGSGLMFLSVLKINLTLSIFALIIGAVLMRFGLGFMLALVQIMSMNKFKKNGGQALGAMNFIQAGSAFIAATWASQFSSHILGLFLVCIICNGATILIHLLLYESHLRFPNIKYKFLKSSIIHDSTRKYVELKNTHKLHIPKKH